MKIVVKNIEYKLKKEYKDGFDLELFKELWTENFKDYDYIVGDYSYSKLRLKGFYGEDNKSAKEFNNIKGLDNYLNKNCAYECKYFILTKVRD